MTKKEKENFAKNKKIFGDIMLVDDNDELWFDRIVQIDDEEFIFLNIEVRIAKHPENKTLWKFYFDYLKQKNSIVRR